MSLASQALVLVSSAPSRLSHIVPNIFQHSSLERNKENLFLHFSIYFLPRESLYHPRFLVLSLWEEMVLQGKLDRCLLSKGERHLLLSSKVVILL